LRRTFSQERLARFRRHGLLKGSALNRTAQTLLDSFSAEISVSQPLSTLDLGQWKCIEIARALSSSPRAVLFDESTAFLNHREVDIVLEAMRALKRQGLTVAFVSRHLAEVGAVADGLTILKDGRKVGDYAAHELGRDQIQSLMVGRDLSKGLFPPHAARASSDNLMRFEDIAEERLKPSSFMLGGGEIVGIAGLKGASGQRILEIAAGVAPLRSGGMKLSGASFRPRIPAEAWAKGIAYLPGDRTGEGLIVGASVLDNLVMARAPRRGPLFDHARAKKLSGALIRRLSIKTKAPQTRAGALSVFGREVRAIGGGERIAHLSGIRVDRAKILIFVLSGLLCGMAGLLQGARAMAATAQLGEGLDLDAIAAVVVGGTPLTGGVGSIQGTILGALIITILSNGMNIIGLDPYFQNIVKGLVLVLSVFITIDREKIGIIK
jgi:ABC-type uncharacterized transport system ATPase subunit